MNVMIATVGVETGNTALGSTAECALFMIAFAAVGVVLLVIGGRLLKSFHEPNAVRYTSIRL